MLIIQLMEMQDKVMEKDLGMDQDTEKDQDIDQDTDKDQDMEMEVIESSFQNIKEKS